jgi:hypothetical protein
MRILWITVIVDSIIANEQDWRMIKLARQRDEIAMFLQVFEQFFAEI